jgi:hypothetical protein
MTLQHREPTTNDFESEKQGGFDIDIVPGQTVIVPADVGTRFTSETAKIASAKAVIARRMSRPDRAIVQAIQEHYPAERVIEMIDDALRIASQGNGSARAILEVVKLILAYTVGQPVQRTVTFTTKFEDMLKEVMGGGEEAED